MYYILVCILLYYIYIYDISENDEDILIGITSYRAVPYERTNLCGDPNYGGVYARVSEGYDWIAETLCKNDTLDVPLPAECTYTHPKLSPKRPKCVDNPDFRNKGRDCEDFLSTKRAERCNRMVNVSHTITFETCIPIPFIQNYIIQQHIIVSL